MPALGMAQDTGKVLRWLKTEGEQVLKGEALMEVETDKVTVEVEAPADGTLAAVGAGEGEDVPVGHRVALILAPNEDVPEDAAAVEATEIEAPVRVAASPDGGKAATAPERPRRPLASPKARRLAAERGVDLASLAGSGPHGAVVAADLAATLVGGDPGDRAGLAADGAGGSPRAGGRRRTSSSRARWTRAGSRAGVRARVPSPAPSGLRTPTSSSAWPPRRSSATRASTPPGATARSFPARA